MDDKLFLARQLRKRQTPAEKIMWNILRTKKLNGYKFRRQHIIAGFIVDFYCPELKSVIEVDGSIHETQDKIKLDKQREIILRSHNLRIIRIKNEYILKNPAKITEFLKKLFPQPSPSKRERVSRHVE